MVKPIVKDVMFLGQKSEPATEADKQIIVENPVITKKIGAYQVEESCLSLTGKRSATRYKEIEVEYQDVNFKKQKQKFSGYVAQIICHEVDHILGIVI